MEQKEFEKQIKDQFENWTMSPSPMVWQHIEQRLYKPDGGRMWWRALAATLIIAILSVGIGYWVDHNKDSKIAQQQQKNTPQTNSTNKQSIQNDNKTSENINNSNNTVKIDKNNTNQSQKQTDIDKKGIQQPKNEQLLITNENRKHNSKYSVLTKTNKYFVANNKRNSKKDNEQKTKPNLVQNETIIPARIEGNIIASNEKGLAVTDISDIKIRPLSPDKVINTSDLLVKLPPKRTIEGSIYFDNGGSWSSDIIKDPVPTRGNEGQVMPVSRSEQAPQKTAYAYRFGANVTIPIFKRWSISSGIAYTSLSNQIMLGDHVRYPYIIYTGNQAMMINEYYSGGAKNNYTTHNIFIEIPISIGFHVFKSKHFPLWATAGVSMLKQIEANNILYDANDRIFYKDNTGMQPTQWQLNFSLNTTLWDNKQFALKIGPYYQLGLNNMYKQSAEQFAKRWQLMGLRLKFDFGGKN